MTDEIAILDFTGSAGTKGSPLFRTRLFRDRILLEASSLTLLLTESKQETIIPLAKIQAAAFERRGRVDITYPHEKGWLETTRIYGPGDDLKAFTATLQDLLPNLKIDRRNAENELSFEQRDGLRFLLFFFLGLLGLGILFNIGKWLLSKS